MTEYTQDASLERAIQAALDNPEFTEFTGLRKSGIKFTSCVRVEQDKAGESVPCKGAVVVTKKVSDLHRLWIPARYIIVVDHATWTTVDAKAQGFLVHTALCNVAVTMSPDGSFKFGVNRPNICAHSAAVNRFPGVADVSRIKQLLLSNGDAMMAPHIDSEAGAAPEEKKKSRNQK